jgi:hypothetical protein
MAPSRFPALFCLLPLAALACPRDAGAQIHRCTTGDGRVIYTDQRCEALGASELPDPAAASVPDTGPKALGVGGARVYRGGCSRTLQDLVYELRTAVDAQDANRLSGITHWVGVSEAQANAMMARLDAIARKPLFDIAPIAPGSAQDTTILAGPTDLPRTTARRPPTGLRLEQVAPDGITPVQTSVGLQRHFGCWWITP